MLRNFLYSGLANWCTVNMTPLNVTKDMAIALTCNKLSKIEVNTTF